MPFTAGALTLLAIGAGVVVGYLRGGRLRHLGSHPLPGARLVPAAVLLQLASALTGGALGLTLLTASYVALLAVAAMSWRVVGLAVAGVGIALNALVIVVNAGMPVRASAIVEAGIDPAEAAAALEDGGKRHLETDADRLVVLGDVIPVRPLRAVLSFGDLILAVGLADAVAVLMRRRSPEPAEPEPAPA